MALTNTTCLARKSIGEYRYEVFYDQFPMDSITNIEFSNEQEKSQYYELFQKGKLNVFGVVKSKVCSCCCLWSEIDSIWGMHFETAEQALNDYIENLEIHR